MDQEFKRQLDRIAETHYYLRPAMVNALKSQSLTDDARQLIGNYQNYAEYWTAGFSDRFFDMGTMIRLGSAIEGCLKYYYMEKKGHKSIVQLKADRACHSGGKFKKGIFQQIQSWQNGGAIALFKDELKFDMLTISNLRSIQEAMVHRHLYTHNSGLIDDEYIDNIKKITGQDLANHPEIGKLYPNADIYWFEPLKSLSHFIEETRRFFAHFP